MTGRGGALLAHVDLAVTAALGQPSRSGPSSRRAVVLLAGAVAGILLGWPGLVVVVVAATVVAARQRRRRTRAARQLLRELNDTVPLLQLAVGAGLTVRAGLAAITPWSAGRFGEDLAALVDRVDDGASLADELDRMPDRLGEGCRGLVAVLGAAERYGSPLVEPLARLGSELRLQQRRQLERAARRVPVQLLLPLALGILPAFVLLAVVPLMATALDGVVLPGR